MFNVTFGSVIKEEMPQIMAAIISHSCITHRAQVGHTALWDTAF